MDLRTRACDPRRLDAFLNSHLPDDSQREMETHLLVCPACCDHLDEMAGGARWWTEVRRHLGGDGDSEFSSHSRSREMSLDFLQPSDNPVSLGKLGSYEVLEVIGRGGMGIVLKAFDPALHRPVAIKVLAAEYAANGSARKRFAREAQATAAVIHDHVVPIHAVDAEAAPPYLVMAYIPGQSLQQRIDRSGPLELKEILRIGMQTALGLAAAHAQGLVHRDIKPANIMLENGIERVRITDFGLARAVDDASITRDGVLAGTPQYMAPEQARGEVVDQRADLFALGSTLYAMCTGRAPFRGEGGIAVIRQVCDVEPISIRSINADVPAWLEGIVRKLHAKDPARRFRTAAELADLLERCLAHVQQPSQQFLPKEADELGRHVPRPSSGRKASRKVLAAATFVLACTAAAVIFSNLKLGKNGTADFEGVALEANGETVLKVLEQVPDEINKARSSLDSLAYSLTAPSDLPGNDAGMDNVRRRIAKMRNGGTTTQEEGTDVIEENIQGLRRRIEVLDRELNHRYD